MNRKLISATTLAIGALLLAGCGTVQGEEVSGEPYPESHYTFEQDLPDGGTVLCVWAKNGYGGGLSCDWDGAQR